MKKWWYCIICVIAVGCNYDMGLNSETGEICETIFLQKNKVSLSDIVIYDKEQEREDICKKFNLAKGNILSAISVGYTQYMEHGGCGEKCFKEDWREQLAKAELVLHASVQSTKLLGKMIKMGNKEVLRVSECDEYLKPEWKNFDTYALEAKCLLEYAVGESIKVAGEKKCDKEEQEKPDEGGGQESNHEIPDILSDYEWAVAHGIDWLLNKVGGDVEKLYVERKSKVEALMISYTLNKYKPIDINQAGRLDKFYYILGGDGLHYIDDYDVLKNYIEKIYAPSCEITDLGSYVSSGLMLGVNKQGNIVFADMWNGTRFVMEGHPVVMKYYYWPFEQPIKK